MVGGVVVVAKVKGDGVVVVVREVVLYLDVIKGTERIVQRSGLK